MKANVLLKLELVFLSSGEIKYRVTGGTLDPLRQIEEMLNKLHLPIDVQEIFSNHLHLLELAGLEEQIHELRERKEVIKENAYRPVLINK